METVAKVNPRANQGVTTQGFYVTGADGSAFAFNNNRSVERVLAFMDKGMSGFRAGPSRQVTIDGNSKFLLEPPVGTSVLRLYSRIKPTPPGCNPSNENLQRDHFWILPEEIARMSNLEVPESLASRLCRFAFVDAIRGEPDFWRREEVRSKSFSLTKTSGAGLLLKGSFLMTTADGNRGMEGTLEAEIAVKENKVSAFKGFAATTAWGQGTYTPGAPAGKFPVKFAFVLAPNSKETVSPQAAMYGREYLGR